MQIYYETPAQTIESQRWISGAAFPDQVVWIDLLEPTREEEQAAEAFLGFSIPTREEMSEIEISNRLYEESGALFVTATMLAKLATDQPETHAVTFVITEKRLVTIRYIDTTSFRRFTSRLSRTVRTHGCGITLFLSLIEAIVNRQADILERTDHDIDTITRAIFRQPPSRKSRRGLNYQPILEQIGRCGDITAKIHESLVTFGRAMVFASQHAAFSAPARQASLSSIRADIAGLSDHGNHLASRASFLLDATLGMISIQQNGVFRILSIASLIFMPPTLVAGIYGMNFKTMPELDWHWGYPMAIFLMVIASILPLAYLRERRWL